MKAFKSFTALFLVVSMVGFLCACNSSEGEKTPSSDNTQSNSIKIEDISWNVDEGIIDGDRYVLLNYKNNSKYTISSFEITFKEKTGVTDEEKENFFTDVKKRFEISDDDIAELKEESISMYAETYKVANPGESVKDAYCFYYSGFYTVKDVDHYNLVEPDIATIKYIDDDKIYTIFYDFVSKKYSVEDEVVVAYEWSTTDLGNKIPKPEVKVVEGGRDDESVFMFDAYGMSLDQFDAYVEQCRALGYTVDESSHEGFYSADNAEGYNVYLYYENDDDNMSGTVKVPEK